jgi:hypothetical protein
MPLFRFIIQDGSNVPQPEPTELQSVDEAKSHAVLLAGQMLKDIDGKFWRDSHWTIRVTDMNDLTFATIDIDGSSAPAGRQSRP